MNSIINQEIENLDAIRESLQNSLVKGQASYSRKPSHDKYQNLYDSCFSHLEKMTAGIYQLCLKTNELLTIETENIKSMETSVEQLMIMSDFMKQGISRRLAGERAIVKSKPKTTMFDRYRKSAAILHIQEFVYDLTKYDAIGYGCKDKLPPSQPCQMRQTNIRYNLIMEPKLYTFTFKSNSMSNMVCFYWKMPFVVARPAENRGLLRESSSLTQIPESSIISSESREKRKKQPIPTTSRKTGTKFTEEKIYHDENLDVTEIESNNPEPMIQSNKSSDKNRRTAKRVVDSDDISPPSSTPPSEHVSSRKPYNTDRKQSRRVNKYTSSTTNPSDNYTKSSGSEIEDLNDRHRKNLTQRSNRELAVKSSRSLKHSSSQHKGRSHIQATQSSSIMESEYSSETVPNYDTANQPHNKRPLYKAKVLYPYKKTLEDELSISLDDIVEVYLENDDGWVLASRRGRFGLIPGNFIQKM